MTRDEQLNEIEQTIQRMKAITANYVAESQAQIDRIKFEAKENPLEGAIMVDRETLPDGSAPLRLSRSIRVF